MPGGMSGIPQLKGTYSPMVHVSHVQAWPLSACRWLVRTEAHTRCKAYTGPQEPRPSH